MGSSRRWQSLAGLLLLTACSPVVAGPELPRPAQSVSTVTIPLTTTTTTEPEPEPLTCPTDFCVKYEVRPGAEWADGSPVTSADFAATAAYFADPIAGFDTSGYDQIREVEKLDPSTAFVIFDEPYSAWQNLFERLVPAGTDDSSVIPSSGPFQFRQWVPGDRIEVVRSEAWWSDVDLRTGDPLGDVAEVTFVFIPDVEARVEALLNGEVDVIATRATPDLVADLGATEGVELVMAPGPFWEHIDFHFDDAMLARPWARQAIALAIDRQKLLQSTIGALDPTASGLGNTVWMGNTAHYEDHLGTGFDPVAAEELLASNGCERADDGIQVCDGRRLSFVWTSTNDDPARVTAFESVREDLEVVGIEIVPDLRPPSQFVARTHLFGGAEVWQLANFSWRDQLDPAETDQRFACGSSDLNVNGYCSSEVTEALAIARAETDPGLRAAAYNDVDRLYLDDLAVIPLYQKPTLMAWASDLTGPVPNYTRSSDVWNVASWTGRPSIVVALPGEPTTLDPRSTLDESANAVLSTLMYGAFSMAPDQTQIPMLISSAEIVEG